MSKSRIKGITVEINGSTTGLEKSLESVNKKSYSLQNQLGDVNRLLKFNPDDVTLVAQKTRLLAEQVENTSDKLQQLKHAEKQVQAQFDKGDIKQEQYEKFMREIVETESKLKHFENQLESTKKGFSQLADKAKEAGESFQQTGENLSTMGTELSTSVSLPLAALGGLALKSASDVESAQGKIQAQLGLTAQEAEELNGIARELFNDAFGENMDEVNQALVTVKQNIKGLNDAELKKVTENAFILKDAFGAEIAESTKTATTLMKNFGIDADEAFDLMTRGFQEGGDYSGELLDSLNEYAPQFSAIGMGADDMVNTLLKGAEAGAFSLDKVGDAVKEFNIRAKDGSDATSDAFTNLGLNAAEMQEAFAEGGEKGQEAFQKVMESLSGLDDEILRNEVGVSLFGTQWEDLEADVVTALGTTKDLLGETEGATKSAGDAMYDNFGTRLTSAWRQLSEAIMPLGIVLLDMAEQWLPKLSAAAQTLAGFFGNLSPKMQTLIVVIAGIAAAIGPVLVVIGTLISAVGTIITTIGPLLALLPKLGTAFAVLTGPVGLVIAAIAAAIAIGVLLYKNWDEVKAIAKVVWNEIKRVITTVLEAIKASFKNALALIKALVTGDFKGMKDIINNQMNLVKTLIGDVWRAIDNIFSKTLGDIWNVVKTKFSDIYRAVTQKMNNVKTKITLIWNNIKSFLQRINLFTIGKNIIQGLINGIGSMALSVVKKAKEIGNSVKNTVKNVLGIASPSKVMKQYGNWVGEGLIDGIYEMVGKAERSAEELASAVSEAAKLAFSKSKKWIDERKYYNELSLTEELKAWERVQARYAEGTDERVEADREVYRLRKEINDKLIDANEEYLQRVKEVNEKVEQEEKRLNEEYEKAVDARTKSIRDFAGLFDEVVQKADTTGKDLLNNLNSQVTALETWAQNLERLARRGIDEGLLEELRQMGPKAGSEIEALNSLTDGELDNYVRLWKQKNQLAREQAESELVGMRKDTDKQIRELHRESAIQLTAYQKEWQSKISQIRYNSESEFNKMKDSMPAIGKNAIDGLIAGLENQRGQLMKTAKSIADAVSGTIKGALEIKSPSRVMMGVGGDIGEGLEMGMNNTISSISRAAKRMAESATPTITTPNVSSTGTNAVTQGINLNFTGPVSMRSEQDIKLLARELHNLTKSKGRGLGIV